MKIYVASSWQNVHRPKVVLALRAAGHEVYDFRNPGPVVAGFHWSEISPDWKNWTVAEHAAALDTPVATAGYRSDMDGLEGADLCVLVLPSGQSASWEYGYWRGMTRRHGVVYMPEKVEPELMWRGAQFVDTIFDLVVAVERASHHPTCDSLLPSPNPCNCSAAYLR